MRVLELVLGVVVLDSDNVFILCCKVIKLIIEPMYVFIVFKIKSSQDAVRRLFRVNLGTGNIFFSLFFYYFSKF